MASLVVLGAGMMGTALTWPLADRGHDVRVVGTHLDGELIASIRASRIHPKLGLRVPDGVTPYANTELAAALVGADAVALGVSSAGVRWAAEQLGPLLTRPLPVAMVSKGLAFDGNAFRILPDVFRTALPPELARQLEPVGIAGPCIAGELARRVPTATVFTARRVAAAETWAELARAPYYHVFSSDDALGVEACAAMKNAYALGVALALGLHEGAGGKPGSIALHNYESAVFAQAVWEMRSFVALLGGDPNAAAWLPGAGDLDVTCNGGRTGRFGHLLGLGLGRDEAIRRMQGATLECLEILAVLREGLPALVARHDTASSLGVAGRFPLLLHLCEIALDGAPVAMPFERFFADRGALAVQPSTLKRSE
jgi:glycerol-3-phosphate dehydrogenase (NAD(P)+)